MSKQVKGTIHTQYMCWYTIVTLCFLCCWQMHNIPKVFHCCQQRKKCDSVTSISTYPYKISWWQLVYNIYFDIGHVVCLLCLHHIPNNTSVYFWGLVKKWYNKSIAVHHISISIPPFMNTTAPVDSKEHIKLVLF